MVPIMASYKSSPTDVSNADRKSSVCVSRDDASNFKKNKQLFDNPDNLNIIRSVAMSANVAFAVVDEVKHFIHVNSFESESLIASEISSGTKNSDFVFESKEDKSMQLNVNRLEHEHDYFHSLMSSCSFVLPSESEALVTAVVISKWDDVIGPQTVHAWLQNKLKCEERVTQELAPRSSYSSVFPVSDSASSGVCSCGFSELPLRSDGRGSQFLHDNYFYKKRLKVLKAIKYVSSHTVNYSSGSVLISEKPTERNIKVFIVPEIDLIAQCIVFQLNEKERRIPYSIALMASYLHYSSCFQFSHYCQHWLQESSYHFQEIFTQCAESSKNFKVTEEVNTWVQEMCTRMTSLSSLKVTSLSPSYYSGVLYSHFLPYALTSHLQTFCCSVVSGTSVHYMNMLIAFLALFLENSEKACSYFAKSAEEFTFHQGLFLQGMLTNKRGLQECNFFPPGKHLDPITSISIVSDVELDPIRQPQFHWLYLANLQNNLHEILIVRNSFEPVKRSASLVNSFLSDMSKLPSTHWNSIIYMFKKKLNVFGHMLLTLVSTLRESDYRSKLVFQGDLCERMGICGADFLIILAVAEKLKPGTYNYVVEGDQKYT